MHLETRCVSLSYLGDLNMKSMTCALGLTSVTLLTVVACGLEGSLGEYPATEQSGSSSESATSAGGTASTSTTATPQGTETGDETGTPPMLTTGTDTGAPGCPAPEPVTASFVVTPDQDIDAICAVVGFNSLDGVTQVALDCADMPVTLDIEKPSGSVIPGLVMGEAVQVRYITDPIFWINRWLAVSTAQGEVDALILGGVAGSALDPPGMTIDTLFASGSGQPLLAAVESTCEPVAELCGPEDRLALEMTILGGVTTQVLDASVGQVSAGPGGYELSVNSAIDRPFSNDCDDLPPAWFQFLVVGFGGD